MAKKKTKRKGELTMAGYEGLCSGFTDMIGMKSVFPSAVWEKHVVSKTISILKFKRPELLEELKKAVREEYESNGKRFPKYVDEEDGTTIRCPACGKTR